MESTLADRKTRNNSARALTCLSAKARRLRASPVFSVQHHPEASPGPTDSLYLFQRFADLMDLAKAMA